MHEFGRAFDLVAEPWALERLGRVWTYVGGSWGGSQDPIHFEA
jgi:hypothetical protein